MIIPMKHYLYITRISQIFFLVFTSSYALAQSQGDGALSSLIAGILERDDSLHSIQIDGRLVSEPSSFVLNRRIMKGKPGFSPTSAADQAPTIQSAKFYFACKGMKDFIGYSQDNSDTSSPANSSAIDERRNALITGDAKIYNGKVNHFIAKRITAKTILMREGKRDSLFGSARRCIRTESDPLTPLSQVLQNFIVVGNEPDARFGTLVHLRSNDNANHELWIAPDRSFLIVKEVAREYQYTKITELLDAELVKGIWMPKEILFKNYSNQLDENSVIQKNTIYYDRVTINDVPDNLFDVKFEVGDRVSDMLTGAWWKIGKGGERLYESDDSKSRQRTMPFGWLYMASVTTLLLLTVAAYVRWKRKPWTKYS